MNRHKSSGRYSPTERNGQELISFYPPGRAENLARRLVAGWREAIVGSERRSIYLETDPVREIIGGEIEEVFDATTLMVNGVEVRLELAGSLNLRRISSKSGIFWRIILPLPEDPRLTRQKLDRDVTVFWSCGRASKTMKTPAQARRLTAVPPLSPKPKSWHDRWQTVFWFYRPRPKLQLLS